MNEKGRTIVGGRSRSNRLVGDFPRGIEILLKKASVDPEFSQYLLQDPLNAGRSIALDLKPVEINILTYTSKIVLEKMIARAATLNIADRFHFTGFLKGDDVYKMFSLSDVYVMPSVSEPFDMAGKEVNLTASLGVTLYPEDDTDAEGLIRHADQAMYAAKEKGRNQFYIFDPG